MSVLASHYDQWHHGWRATVSEIRWQTSRSILSPVSGFLKDAGFTHSLTPARNCTFGCTYCYVPTMRVQAGLKKEDWDRWGQFTTFKQNTPELLRRELRPEMAIYCSPLTDPYQPAEAAASMMPPLLEVLLERPPRVFVIQTRGTLILRDLPWLQRAAAFLRVSFSLTTNDDAVRKRFEPHCAPIAERAACMARLSSEGVAVTATLAPILPCDPDELVALACRVTQGDLIGDPFHIRATKPNGATTKDAAFRILAHHGQSEWATAAQQAELAGRLAQGASRHGRKFTIGPAGFGQLCAVL
jgi:DNA repair photolyase